MVLGEEERTGRCFGACLNLNKQQTTRCDGQKILRKVCAGKRLSKEEAAVYLQLLAAPGQAEPRARRDVGTGTSDGAEKDFVHDEEMFQLMERSLERAKAMLRKRVAEVVERDEMHKKMQLELKYLEIRYQDAQHQIIDGQERNQDILNSLSKEEEGNAALKEELSVRQRQIIDSEDRNHAILKDLSKMEKENAALKTELSARQQQIIDTQNRNQNILEDLSKKEEVNAALKAELLTRQREIFDSEDRNHDILGNLSKKEKEDAALKEELSARQTQIIYSQDRNQGILKDLSKKEEENAALKAELSARQLQIIVSQGRNHEILEDLSKKEKENAALKAELLTRQRKIINSQGRNQDILEDLSKKEKENTALKAELSECQREVMKKEEQNAALKAELSTLHEQYDGKYMYKLMEQRNAIITLTAEKEQLIEDVARLQGANRELGSELEKRRNGSNSLQVGLDDFNLLKVIGRGAYGKVILVEEKMTSHLHVMKLIKKERVTRQAIEIERDVMKLAKDCPFLISMRYCFQTTTRVIFVMEYASGGDMLTHMQKRNRLPEEHVKFYGAEIVVAVNFLHERGVAYRDLKLDNILIDQEGHLKLADFGLCKNELQQGMLMKTFCGTPKCIAPEMLIGREYGFSVDWWAVGIILYELIIGYPPPFIGKQTTLHMKCVTAIALEYTVTVTHLPNILCKDVQLEDWVSIEASALILGFLIKNPEHRLGCNRQWGFLSITSHRFFSGIDWGKVAQKELRPPFKPSLTSSQDVGNFDTQFTSQPACITPDNSLVEDERTEQFRGFGYTVSGHHNSRSVQSEAQGFGTKPPPVPGAQIY